MRAAAADEEDFHAKTKAERSRGDVSGCGDVIKK